MPSGAPRVKRNLSIRLIYNCYQRLDRDNNCESSPLRSFTSSPTGKTSTPDIQILKEAKAEYAKVQ